MERGMKNLELKMQLTILVIVTVCMSITAGWADCPGIPQPIIPDPAINAVGIQSATEIGTYDETDNTVVTFTILKNDYVLQPVDYDTYGDPMWTLDTPLTFTWEEWIPPFGEDPGYYQYLDSGTTLTEFQYHWSLPGEKIIRCTVDDDGYCGDDDPVYIEFSVTVHSDPISVSLSTSDDSVCLGGTITITATAIDKDEPDNWDTIDEFTWYIDGAEYTAGSNQSSITPTFSSLGISQISVVVDDHTYYWDDPAVTATTLVQVYKIPDPPIRAVAAMGTSDTGPWQGDRLDVALGQTIYFTGNWLEDPSYDQDIALGGAVVDDPIASYDWGFGDTSTDNGVLVSHAYSATGAFLVSLTADDTGTTFDDPEEEACQLRVRVFATTPAVPIVVEPAANQPYCSLTPLVCWAGEMHDKFQARIGLTSDPNDPAIWDSDEVTSEDSEIVCGTALDESTTYYAFVREHNIFGWGQWSVGTPFTVLENINPPVNDSLDPSAGTLLTGVATTFTASYSDYCRYVNIGIAELLIDDPCLDRESACHLRYDQNSNTCWLADENGNFTIGGEDYTPESTNVLENDLVKVYLEDTSVYDNSTDTLYIDWSVEFKDTFTGPKLLALAVANDNGLAGDDNYEQVGSITIIKATGSTSLVSSPTSCQYVNGLPINILGTASDVGEPNVTVTQVEVSTDDGATWSTATGTTSWTYTWQSADDGVYMIRTRATNSNQVVEIPGSATKVTLDRVAPVSTIYEPVNGATIDGYKIDVSGTAYDETSGISMVELTIDDGYTWVQANGTDAFLYSFPILETGTYTIKSRATDKAGNVETPGDGVTVTVDYEEGSPLPIGSGVPQLPIDEKLFESQKLLQFGRYSSYNTMTSDLTTTIPVVGWNSMGDLGINFSLCHLDSREGAPWDPKGIEKRKWMHSYQSYIKNWSYDGKVLVYPNGERQYWKLENGVYVGKYGNKDILTTDSGGFTVEGKKSHIKAGYTRLVKGTDGQDTWLPTYIEQPEGQRITLEYNFSWLLYKIKDPDGKRSITLNWGTVGTSSNPIYVLKSVKVTRDFLAGLTGRGGTVTYKFDYEGSKMIRVSYPVAGAGDVPVGPFGKDDPRNSEFYNYSGGPVTVNFSYDNEGRIKTISNGNYGDNSWTFDYITDDYALSATDGEGRKTTIGRLRWPYNAAQNADYDSISTTVIDPLGHETGYFYIRWWRGEEASNLGRTEWTGFRLFSIQKKWWNELPVVSSYDWTKEGYLNWSSDAYGRRTVFTWDDRGNLKEVRDPMWHRTKMTYTQDDLLETVTTPEGRTTKNTYDDNYRIIKTQIDPDVLNITTDYTYDTYGNVATVVGPYYGQDPAPLPVTYTYDMKYHQYATKVTDQAGRFVTSKYDSLGNLEMQSLPRLKDTDNLAVNWQAYDKCGRTYLSWNWDDCYSMTKYYANGNVAQTIDAIGQVTDYKFTCLDQPWHTSRREQNDPELENPTYIIDTENVYDDEGKPLMVKLGGAGWPDFKTMMSNDEYDQWHRIAKVTSHGTSEWQSYYKDSKPKQTSKYDGNIYKHFDGAGRLVKTEYTTNGQVKTARFEYDNDGLLTKVFEDWTCTGGPAREYFYDAAGRLWKEIRNDIGRTIYYGYTADGKPETTMIQESNNPSLPSQSFYYEYYPDGSLLYIRDEDYQYTSFIYDFRGRLYQKGLPNGAYIVYKYYDTKGASGYCDSRNLVYQIEHHQKRNNRPFYVYTNTYDNSGAVLTSSGATVALNGQLQEKEKVIYEYDKAGRLISENRTCSAGYGSPYHYDYTYDPAGNRLTKVSGSITTTYNYGANPAQCRLHSTTNPAVAYQYDLNSNLIEKRVGTSSYTYYEYDISGNLTRLTLPDNTTRDFVYNSGGERIEKVAGTTKTRFVHIGGSLYQELGSFSESNPWGSIVRWYNPGISQTVGTTKTCFHTDLHGNTARLTNSGGNVLSDRYAYDAWGNTAHPTGISDTRFQYVGGEGYYTDPDVPGLIKLGARYYDPTIGRFITPDPAGDGLNWYAYCGNDPVNATDPTGLTWRQNLEILMDFLLGRGPSHRFYGANDNRTKEMWWSGGVQRARREATIAISQGKTSGHTDWTTREAIQELPRATPTAFQVGAYTVNWTLNKKTGVITYTINNTLSFNSLIYHVFSAQNYLLSKAGFNITLPSGWSQPSPMGYIYQTFEWTETIKQSSVPANNANMPNFGANPISNPFGFNYWILKGCPP